MSKNIKIFIATHKHYRMPDVECYIPVHAGKKGKDDIGYIGDDTGINISEKNYYYNEMTVQYWALKNVEADYIGFVHYRRYFTNANLIRRILTKDKFKLIATVDQIEKKLEQTDIIVPQKRRYVIDTLEEHYYHLPYTVDSDLSALRTVLSENYPEYKPAFEEEMKKTWGYMFNMFIMKQEYFKEYATWAFDVLKKVDEKISMNGRTTIQARLYISEFLLETWLFTKGYKYVEMPVMYMEKQNLIKKCAQLFIRKLKRNKINEEF